MILDDKKIEEAARRYSEVTDCDKEEALLIEEGFKEGASWAINELIKGLWHPASEEPRKGAKFLYQNHYNSRFYYYIDKIDDILETYPNWSSYVKHVRVIQWLYIEDLFPKEGGEQ